LCDPKPSAFSYLKHEHICGRPLGIRFDKKTGDMYIADAYFGLLKVGPEGGLATQLTTEAEGVPLKFTNDLDIDEEGVIYFTDSSTKYQRRLLLFIKNFVFINIVIFSSLVHLFIYFLCRFFFWVVGGEGVWICRYGEVEEAA
jgi:Strictosidine synthase